MTLQVAKFNNVLAFVVGICDNGNEVIFSSAGGRIVSIKTSRGSEFRRQGKEHVMQIWVLNPEYKGEDGKRQDSSMQGQSR